MINQESVAVTDKDREAARRALTRNWPDLAQGEPKYAALLAGLATFHAVFGADRFELRYNLRPPRDRTEEWERHLMHGQITEEQFRSNLKADAERPIDLEMLTAFHNAYDDELAHYSGVLQQAVLKPSDDAAARRDKEKAINAHVAALRRKLPLWTENLNTVFDFLEELRITSGKGLVKLGDFEATSAHWLAQLLFTRTCELWRCCKQVSKRSHTDPCYLYAANAVDLFFHQCFPTLPAPQGLSERLREEFILARAALKQTSGPRVSSPQQSPMPTGSSAAFASIDNESRELTLLGEMYSLVAQAGHIFRPVPNSDWGIDGEIEFKDHAGRASGQRLYVQLKSGESHLVRRKHDGQDIFTVKNERHLEYWTQHAYPVMLVIRQSSGIIRWTNVTAYLAQHGHTNRQIVFTGEPVTIESIRQLADQSLSNPMPLATTLMTQNPHAAAKAEP
jgi:hypothetical protein